MTVGVFVGFVLPVLTQNRLAGDPGDGGQVGWGGLGDGGVTSVQQELPVIDDPGPFDGGNKPTVMTLNTFHLLGDQNINKIK